MSDAGDVEHPLQSGRSQVLHGDSVSDDAAERAAEDAAESFMRRMIGDRRWERLPAATRAHRSLSPIRATRAAQYAAFLAIACSRMPG